MTCSRVPIPHRRYGFWYLVRKVPRGFARLDRRGVVRVSTGIRITDDPRGVTAKRAVERLDAELNHRHPSGEAHRWGSPHNHRRGYGEAHSTP